MTEQLATLNQQRSTAKSNISRIKNNLEKQTSINTIDLECRLDILNSYIKQIMAYQTEIEKLNSADDKRAEIEELCISAKSKLLSLLGNSRRRESTAFEQTLGMMPSLNRLPHLKLPLFDGKYSEYKNFIGSFKNLVEEEVTLSPIEKFNHLLTCLSGDALKTVQAFQVTEENYPKALERLAERYDKKTLIFFNSIDQIFDIPVMNSPNASSLRCAVDTVSAIYDSLLSIGDTKDITNALLIHIILSKVDNVTKTRWNDQLDYQKLPSWDDCSKMLIRRCQSFEVNEVRSLF